MTQKRLLAQLRPYRVKREIFCRPLSFAEGNEVYIVFDASTGKLLELNSAARQIYHLCDGRRSITDIARELYPNCSKSLLNKAADTIFDFKRNGWVEIPEVEGSRTQSPEEPVTQAI